MDERATKLIEEAMRLPAEARAAMAGTLLESLDEEVDEDAEAAWADEIARRLRAYDAGESKSVPWSEARRRILASD